MDESQNTRARKTGPLEEGELDIVRREYIPKVLSQEEREAMRLVCGRSLYDLYYKCKEDQSAYLNTDEQSAYTDRIIKLARTQIDNPVIRMTLAAQYFLDNEDEFKYIEAAHNFKRKLLPKLQPMRGLYELAVRYRALSPEERMVLYEQEMEIGIELLPPPQKNIFERWKRNKYRGNWFAGVTGEVSMLAHNGFFDKAEKNKLLQRAETLKNKTAGQAGKRKNTIEDVQEGDALIQAALEQLFPSLSNIRDGSGEVRKKELQKLLNIQEDN